MTRSRPASAWRRRAFVRKLHRRDVRCVIDVHGRFGEGVHRRRDPGEVELLEEAGPEALRVDVGDAREQAQDELLLAHLEAEHSDAPSLLDRRVLGDVEGQARLAHRRSSREDDQVALLQACRQRVEVREAGADATDLAAMGVEVVQAVVGVVEEGLQGAEPDVDPLLADREQLGFGAIDRLADLGGVLVADTGDPAGRPDEVAEHGLALDDPGVLGGVDGSGRLVRQAREIGTPADRVELLTPFERLGDGHDVDGLAPLEEVEDGRVDPPVGLAVEVLGAEELGHLDDRVAIDEDGAQDRLLGLETLGRQAVDHGLPA